MYEKEVRALGSGSVSSGEISRRRFLAHLGGAATAGALPWGGCARAPEARPNVVLVVLDTVRPDHVGAWGYPKATSPNLDAFVKTATQYTRAYAPTSWTLPTHASLFTGLYPFAHHTRAYLVEDEAGNPQIYEAPLDEAHGTLAEALQQEGYATAGFVANTVYLKERYQLHQGMDTYHVERVPGVELAPQALAWIEANKSKPFFLFLNFMDAHYPYNVGPLPGGQLEAAPQDEGLLLEYIEKTLIAEAPVDPELTAQVIAQYDTGIAHADRGLAAILDGLKSRGLFDDTLIMVLSDHGEFFGEHDLAQHSKDLYEEGVRVPLAVKLPGQRKSSRHDAPVSLVEMPRLAIRALGETTARRYPHLVERGADLPLLTEIYYTRSWDLFDERWGRRFHRVRTALYDWPWKYIHSSDGNHELYHLERDPVEAANLYEPDSQRVVAMVQRLERVRGLEPAAPRRAPPAFPQLTPQDEEEMRALGYL